MSDSLTVVAGGNIEAALRVFSKRVQNSGVVLECRRRSAYLKPSERKRVKAQRARRRAAKERKREAERAQYVRNLVAARR